MPTTESFESIFARRGLVAVITGAFVGALLSVSGGVMAAANTGHAGPDYAGIAALLASVTGLVSAIGALVIALRRRDSEPRVIVVHDDEVEHQPVKRKRRAT